MTCLRRNLKPWQVIGLSVGLMAPSMAISINPQLAVQAVGRAIPLSFVIAMAGALLVAYGFSRLSQHFNSSGSVLGLVGATLGARAGVVAGWCLAGTYVIFSLLTGITAGIFGTQFLQAVSIIHSDPTWLAYTIGGLTVVVAGLMAVVPASRATEVIVSFEGVTIAFIVVAAAVVLAKLLGHSGPGHLGFTWSVFVPAPGTTTSNVFLGVVFGLLSFSGFEGAATLGGEAENPRRAIPQALIGVVAVMGAFYVVVSAIEVMGFGTSSTDLQTNFYNSGNLLGTLGQSYVAPWFGDVIILGTVISAFGCSMASVVGASRIVMTFVRDAVDEDHPLARIRPGTQTPAGAVIVLVVIEAILFTAFGVAATAPLTLVGWTGLVATLLIMVAYGLVTIGALLFLFVRPWRSGALSFLFVRPWRSGAPARVRAAEAVLPAAPARVRAAEAVLPAAPARVRAVEAVLPVAGVVVLGYTVYRNVVPYPTGSSFWLPIVAGGWLLMAVVFVAVAPGTSRRLGARMLTEEGTEELVAAP